MNNSLNSNSNPFIKADDNKIINENCIRWVQKMNDCLEDCTKSSGCNRKNNDTHKICKINNPESYAKLNLYFS